MLACQSSVSPQGSGRILQDSPIAVAKATLWTDPPPYNVNNTVTLDGNKDKVNTDTKSRHQLCQCIGVDNFEKVNGSSSGDFGFIPLQPLGKIIDKGCNLGLNIGYVVLHKQFGHSHISNCVGSQYSIPTDLNIALWEELLTGNRDHQLISFIKYGFPLDISQSSELEPNLVVTNLLVFLNIFK